MENIDSLYLNNVKKLCQNIKKQGENSISQIKNDSDLIWAPDEESNSVTILVTHLYGNMRSRWTNIFTEDGEKADRNRPSEFDQNFKTSRDELLKLWEDGWTIFLNTLNSLTPEDLMKTIYIRNEPHLVFEAIQRQLVHYANHVGQITYLSKQIEWKDWKTLSIPRNKEVFDYHDLKK